MLSPQTAAPCVHSSAPHRAGSGLCPQAGGDPSAPGGRLKVTDTPLPVQINGLQLPPFHRKLMREGPCVFREVPIPVNIDWAFSHAWKKHKRAFLKRGFTIRKIEGKWMLSQWLTVVEDGSYTLTQIGQERLDGLATITTGQLGLTTSAPQLILPDLPHGLADKLRGYQVDPTRQIYRALLQGSNEWGFPGAADLSDMGVGKTYMDLCAAIATGKQIGILCPTVGAAGWRRACEHFGIEPLFISTYEAVRGAFRPHIATMDATGKFTWANPNNLVLILDEAQALRHDDTLTVRCCSAAIRQGVAIIVASATIATSPLEMRFAGRVTGLHKGFEDWERFLTEHGCLKVRTSWKWDGKTHHLIRINNRLFPFRGARVRKQDLGEECPETIIEPLPFHIPEGAKIEQEWRDTEEMLQRIGLQGGGARVALMEQRARMKVWQRCERVLVPYIAERVRRDVREGKSVAVFMNFNESRIELAKLLKTTAGFYGGQPLHRRQHWEREFQADREHILINNIGAGGASVSLHDVRGERSRVAYIFPTDDVVKMEQATGRVDRVGGQSISQQFIPYVAGTMTEKMIARTRNKMRRIATLNDGSSTSGAKF